jgi:hypothetical protein
MILPEDGPKCVLRHLAILNKTYEHLKHMIQIQKHFNCVRRSLIQISEHFCNEESSLLGCGAV